MRFLLTIQYPLEPFNQYVREGTVGQIIQEILEETKPEAVYFAENHGARSAVMVIDVASAAQIPVFAEPWFLKFNASCEFRVAMTPEDLQNADLGALGQKWS
jgi:hypothetical protein